MDLAFAGLEGNGAVYEGPLLEFDDLFALAGEVFSDGDAGEFGAGEGRFLGGEGERALEGGVLGSYGADDGAGVGDDGVADGGLAGDVDGVEVGGLGD